MKANFCIVAEELTLFGNFECMFMLEVDQYEELVAEPRIFVNTTTWNDMWSILHELYIRPHGNIVTLQRKKWKKSFTRDLDDAYIAKRNFELIRMKKRCIIKKGSLRKALF